MEINNLVTITIPVYNRTSFFEEAVESALNQTVSVAVIIVDNASETTYFKEFVENRNISKLKYIRNDKNLGMVGNWNKCIDICHTDYLSILHDDDCLHPEFIAKFLEFKKDNNKHNFAFVANCTMGNKTNWQPDQVSSIEYYEWQKKNFLLGTPSPFPGIVFPVASAKAVNCFDEAKFPIADLDFWLRLSQNIKFYKTKSTLAFYRVSMQQASNGVGEKIVKLLPKFYNDNYSNEPLKNLIFSFLISRIMIFKLKKIYNSSYKISTNFLFRKIDNKFHEFIDKLYLKLIRIYKINQF